MGGFLQHHELTFIKEKFDGTENQTVCTGSMTNFISIWNFFLMADRKPLPWNLQELLTALAAQSSPRIPRLPNDTATKGLMPVPRDIQDPIPGHGSYLFWRVRACLARCWFFFFFLWPHCSIWKLPGQGSKWSCSWSLYHSYSNTRSEPHVRSMPQLATPDP